MLAWTGAELFIKAAQMISGSIDSSSFLSEMGQLQNLDLGTMPPFTTTHANPNPTYSRVFNTMEFIDQIQKGKLVPFLTAPVDTP